MSSKHPLTLLNSSLKKDYQVDPTSSSFFNSLKFLVITRTQVKPCRTPSAYEVQPFIHSYADRNGEPVVRSRLVLSISVNKSGASEWCKHGLINKSYRMSILFGSLRGSREPQSFRSRNKRTDCSSVASKAGTQWSAGEMERAPSTLVAGPVPGRCLDDIIGCVAMHARFWRLYRCSSIYPHQHLNICHSRMWSFKSRVWLVGRKVFQSQIKMKDKLKN